MEATAFKNINTFQVFWEAPETSELNMQLKKINKSHAICCDQKGYGNKRAINAVFRFSPFKKVYIFSI